MSSHTIGILVGGLVPAFLYGISGIFAKWSTSSGIGFGLYLILIGVSVTFVGGCVYLYEPDKTLNLSSCLSAVLLGLSWGLATGAVAVALHKYEIPLSILVPLYNMNTLVAVILGLWIFSEWKDVETLKLFAGSLLIVIGGTMVANS